MASKVKKAKIVESIVENLQNAQGAIFVDFRGINVVEDTILRQQLSEVGVQFRVVKNTMLRLAAKQLEIEDDLQAFIGPTAMAFTNNDPVSMAKVLTKFQKDTGKLEVKAGLLGTALVPAADVKTLAALPSREELLAKVAGGIAAPLTGFAGAINGILRNVVTVIDAVREQREQEEAA